MGCWLRLVWQMCWQQLGQLMMVDKIKSCFLISQDQIGCIMEWDIIFLFVIHIYNSDEVFISHLISKHHILYLPFFMGLWCHILCLPFFMGLWCHILYLPFFMGLWCHILYLPFLMRIVVSYFVSPILWYQGKIMLIDITYVHTLVLLTKDINTYIGIIVCNIRGVPKI